MKKISVFLVDDEPTINRVHKDMLEFIFEDLEVKDYMIQEFTNGVEVLKFLEDDKKANIDIIFTDLSMPIMSGFKLAETLIENFYNNFKFLACISGNIVDINEGDLFDFVIQKPTSFERLEEVIQKVVNRD